MSAAIPPWQPPPAIPVAPLGKPLGGWFSFLALAVQLSLVLSIWIAGYTAVTSLEGLVLMDNLQAGRGTIRQAQDFDARVQALLIAAWASFLLTAGLFISWMRTLRTSAAVAPEAMRHGAGWTIGAWFVPILNFVRPYQIMVDLWRAMVRPARPSQAPGQPPVPALVTTWWAMYLIMSIGSRVLVASLTTQPDSLDLAAQACRLEIAIDTISAVTAVLAIVVVRMFTARARATPPPTAWTPLPNVWPSAAPFYPGTQFRPAQPEARFPYGRPAASQPPVRLPSSLSPMPTPGPGPSATPGVPTPVTNDSAPAAHRL